MGKINGFGILPRSKVIMGWAVCIEDPFYAEVTRLTVICQVKNLSNSWKEAWFLVDMSIVARSFD